MKMMLFLRATFLKSSKGGTCMKLCGCKYGNCTYKLLLGNKCHYQTKSLETAPEICGCRTTDMVHWYLFNGLFIQFILSPELLFR